ncbi:MAG TPA: TOPRIM nucleotidyl transferase/hydrolase domain-containing protein [Gaiellales bacterium]
MTPRAVMLVEGRSDEIAVRTLARLRGRDLAAEDVSVLATGGAQAMGRFLAAYGPSGANVTLAGLCDEGEEPSVRRALERAGLAAAPGRAGLEQLGFFVCERDLEDELVRGLGIAATQALLDAHGKLGAFRTYQKQPAHRARPTADQLRGFLNNWKVDLAGPLVEALEPARVPRPLNGVLACV